MCTVAGSAGGGALSPAHLRISAPRMTAGMAVSVCKFWSGGLERTNNRKKTQLQNCEYIVIGTFACVYATHDNVWGSKDDWRGSEQI